jgi:hypothetical protein
MGKRLILIPPLYAIAGSIVFTFLTVGLEQRGLFSYMLIGGYAMAISVPVSILAAQAISILFGSKLLDWQNSKILLLGFISGSAIAILLSIADFAISSGKGYLYLYINRFVIYMEISVSLSILGVVHLKSYIAKSGL